MFRQQAFLVLFLLLFNMTQPGETLNIQKSLKTENIANNRNNQIKVNNENNNNTQNNTQNSNSPEPFCSRYCFYLQHASCSICYQQCVNNLWQTVGFQIKSCELKECKKATAEAKSEEQHTPKIQCVEWQITALSDQKCAEQCCQSKFQQFTLANTQICLMTDLQHIQEDSQTSTIIAIVLSSTLGGIIVIVILICCGKRFCICCQNLIWPIEYVFRKQKHHRQESGGQSGQQQKSGKIKKKRLIWKLTQKNRSVSDLGSSKSIIQNRNQINPESLCSICLDDQLNSQTHCGHGFHLLCLKMSLQKKFTCPQCRNKNFNPIKITCEYCSRKQTKIELKKQDLHKESFGFLKNNKISCNKCIYD